MSKKTKLILFPILGTVVAASIIAPVALVSAKKINSAKAEKVNNGNNTSKSSFSTFPFLNTKDYYQFIRINDEGKAYFDDCIVSAIVKDVLTNINDYDKEVKFDYKFIDKTTLVLKFKIVFGNKEQAKKYTFKINNENEKNKINVEEANS